MIVLMEVKSNQPCGRLAAGFEHVFGEPKDPVDRADDCIIAHKRALSLDPLDPAFALELEQRLASRRVAHMVLLDDFVLGRNRLPGRQRAAADFTYDLLADLEIFRRCSAAQAHWRIVCSPRSGLKLCSSRCK